MDAAFLGLVVEGEVGVVLEDAEFAEFFGADAAGGDIGDAASFEADACVGDVFASGEDGDPDGVDAFDGAFDEVEDDFEVVDHEIEDDADVDGAVGEGGEPVGFDEDRAGETGFEETEDRVEAFDVADLEDEAAVASEVGEGLGLFGIIGDGFFDEDVFAEREEVAADVEVGNGGGGDGDGAGAGGEVVEGGDGAGFEFCGDFCGAGGVGVEDGGEVDAWEGGEDAGVVASDGTGTGDAHGEVSHGRRLGAGRGEDNGQRERSGGWEAKNPVEADRVWCSEGDSNPHGYPYAPQTYASTNSAIRACPKDPLETGGPSQVRGEWHCP